MLLGIFWGAATSWRWQACMCRASGAALSPAKLGLGLAGGRTGEGVAGWAKEGPRIQQTESETLSLVVGRKVPAPTDALRMGALHIDVRDAARRRSKAAAACVAR